MKNLTAICRPRRAAPFCHPLRITPVCHPEPLTSFEDRLREGNTPDPCHPERSEGSQRWRCYSNASVDYVSEALRFFASLRSAQNDKLGRCACSGTDVCHPEPFAALENRLREGSRCRRYALAVRILFVPVMAEVGPCGIGCFYQFDLLSSQPAFNGLFSVDGRDDVTESFIIDECVNVVFRSKTLDEFILMLIHSASNVVGQADVECAGSVGHDVHVILMVFTHVLHCNVKWRSVPDSSRDFLRRIESSAAPQNDKWSTEPLTTFKDRLREVNPTLCHPERSEGSQRWRHYSNASVDYTPVAFRFFASLRSAQNDKLWRSAQNDKLGRSDRNDRQGFAQNDRLGQCAQNDKFIQSRIQK